MTAPGIFRALEHRNYRLYFFGQGLSLTGTWLQQVAMSWLTYRLSGSPLLLGFVTFCQYIAVLLIAPLAGVLADRVDRRRALLMTQSVMLAQALTLAVLTATGIVTVWHVAALALVLGCASAFDIPLRHAMIARLVGHRSELPNAIALNSLLINSARVVGPALAGLLIAAAGEAFCFALNALSFAAVLVALARMRWQSSAGPPPPQGWVHSWLEGVRSALGFAPIRAGLLLIAAISATLGTYSTLMPVFAKDVFGGGARTLGLLLSSAGTGALLSALYLASRRTTRGLDRVILVAGTGAALAMLAFSRTTHFALALPLLMVLGAGLIAAQASIQTLVQTLLDEDKRGRVMSLYTMAFLGSLPFGNLLSGAIARYAGEDVSFLLSGTACLVALLLFWRALPALRAAARPVYARLGAGGERQKPSP
ncbi:MAG TPA: MFS transporter [Casimicrobiaceae bacterium]|nr:MFS transporter [Casimicrobiaceae bacterium]